MFNIDNETIERSIYNILQAVGENPEREGLKETPKRVAKMLNEMLEGIQYTNQDIANMYGKTFPINDTANSSMVVMKNIECFSFCEHHLALMYNMKISVGYIPTNKVIGLSKIPRICEMCCKRLQLQEKIGADIAEVISLAADTTDVIVYIEACHSCVSARGVKADTAITRTLTTSDPYVSKKYIKQFMKLIK